jgi:CheY-like chemotaxis protein
MTMGGISTGNAQESDFDLDFTKCFPVVKPAAAPAPAPRVPQVPAAAAAVPQQASDIVCYARAVGGSEKIPENAPVLVVEDHEGTRRMMEKMMELLKFPVRVAADSREFARELRQPPAPRLVLLDVGLPRVDGFQILSHLRAHPRTKSIPVVMVTGRSERKDVIRGLMLGADGYVAKPVSLAALRSVIETVLWKQ